MKTDCTRRRNWRSLTEFDEIVVKSGSSTATISKPFEFTNYISGIREFRG
jgi:hypothetical protein